MIKNKYKNISLSIIVIVFLLFFIVHNWKSRVNPAYQIKEEIAISNNISNTTVGEISNQAEISQSFRVTNSITGFEIMFATYQRVNLGTTTVKLLRSSDNECLFKEDISNEKLKDNEYYRFNIENPIEVIDSEEFVIIITSSIPDINNAVTIWKSDTDSYQSGILKINEIPYNGDLVFRVWTELKTSQYIPIIYFTICIILIAGCIIAWYFIYKRGIEIHKIFLVEVCILGILYAFIMTPNSTPDEIRHFETAYNISNFFMGYGIVNEEPTLQMRECDAFRLYELSNSKKSILTLIENIGIKEKRKQMVAEQNISVKNTMFYQYLGPAIGITIGRLLGLNATIVYYLGRMVNFIIYILLLYWAIKKIPFCKPLLFAVALLPMSIHQAISYSYDVPTNALTFLFIAYSLKIIYDGLENITKKDKIITVILAILMAGCKGGAYMPICLILVVLFLGKENSKNKKFVITIIIFALLMFLFINIVNLKTMDSQEITINGNEIILYSKKWVLQNPLKYMVILFKTLYSKGEFYLKTMIGQFLGPLNTEINIWIIWGFISILILSCIQKQDDKISYKKYDKIGFILAILGVFLLIETALFTGWTEYGSGVVEGVQGRYFLPILPIILLLLRTDSLIIKKDIEKEIMMGTYLLQVITVIELFGVVMNK